MATLEDMTSEEKGDMEEDHTKRFHGDKPDEKTGGHVEERYVPLFPPAKVQEGREPGRLERIVESAVRKGILESVMGEIGASVIGPVIKKLASDTDFIKTITKEIVDAIDIDVKVSSKR